MATAMFNRTQYHKVECLFSCPFYSLTCYGRLSRIMMEFNLVRVVKMKGPLCSEEGIVVHGVCDGR